MIGRDQSQLKTFVNNPKPTRNILLPGPPSLLTTTDYPRTRPGEMWENIVCRPCQSVSSDHHERGRELSRVNFGCIKRVAGGSILLLMFDNNALYFV